MIPSLFSPGLIWPRPETLAREEDAWLAGGLENQAAEQAAPGWWGVFSFAETTQKRRG